jgi:DNA-binding transcriptional LysR family regulator
LLYDGFAPFYEQLTQLEARVKGGVVGGTLKLFAAGHLLRHLVPEWLRKLQSKRPDITVALSELPHADLSLLRRGEADVLVDWIPEVPVDVEVREVARTEAWIVAPTHGPFAQKGKLSLATLARPSRPTASRPGRRSPPTRLTPSSASLLRGWASRSCPR